MGMSHRQVVAVPTAAATWTDFTAIPVPSGAARISKISVGIAVDEADPAGVRIAPVFRLTGAGLLEQNPHEYCGPAGNITAKTTSGAFAFEGNIEEYDVDIPVSVGGQVIPQVMTIGEAVTAGTCSIQITFDSKAASGKNSMAQQVNAAMTTTAGAWAAVDTLQVPQLVSGKSPVRIKEIALVVATDQATLALLRCASSFRITGAGVAEGGQHEFLGPQSGTGCNTAGILGYSRQLVRQKVDIPVNAGGQIVVEQYLVTETPTAGSVIFGVLYE